MRRWPTGEDAAFAAGSGALVGRVTRLTRYRCAGGRTLRASCTGVGNRQTADGLGLSPKRRPATDGLGDQRRGVAAPGAWIGNERALQPQRSAPMERRIRWSAAKEASNGFVGTKAARRGTSPVGLLRCVFGIAGLAFSGTKQPSWTGRFGARRSTVSSCRGIPPMLPVHRTCGGVATQRPHPCSPAAECRALC